MSVTASTPVVCALLWRGKRLVGGAYKCKEPVAAFRKFQIALLSSRCTKGNEEKEVIFILLGCTSPRSGDRSAATERVMLIQCPRVSTCSLRKLNVECS